MHGRGDVGLGPAKYAIAGAVLLAAGALVWHIARIQKMRAESAGSAGARFSLDTLTLPRERVLVAARPGSFPQLPPEPPTLSREEAEAFRLGRSKLLVAGDPVIGVVVGGEARAYPIRLLDFHEVVNDTVGDLPLVVSWHPLSGAAGVFARRVESSRLTFSSSGVLYNSTLLLADDREPASLWSQLLGRGVSGPGAGVSLKRLPFVLTRWDAWIADHPRTRVLQPAPEMTKVYKQTPYRSYRGSDDLQFEAGPLPPPGLRRKAEVLVVRAGDQRRVYPFSLLAERVDAAGFWSTTLGGVKLQFRYMPGSREDDAAAAVVTASGGEPLEALPCYWFAWYSTHPDDATLAE
jgi:hypothetical protein